MKGRISFSAVVLLLIATFLAMGAARPDHERNDSISKLKARISSLEQRVEGLEKRLRAVTAGRATSTRGPSIRPHDQAVPRVWPRREFNAAPFFIPLKKEQTPSRTRSLQKIRR